MQMPRQRKIFLSRSIWLLGRLHRQLVWLFWSCLWVCHMFWHLTDCLGCLLLLDIFFLWLTFDSELSLYFRLPVNSNFSWSWACLYRNSPRHSPSAAHRRLLPAQSMLPKVFSANAASLRFGLSTSQEGNYSKEENFPTSKYMAKSTETLVPIHAVPVYVCFKYIYIKLWCLWEGLSLNNVVFQVDFMQTMKNLKWQVCSLPGSPLFEKKSDAEQWLFICFLSMVNLGQN